MKHTGKRARRVAGKLLVDQTAALHIQMLRYGFVAAIALAVDFGSLIFLHEVFGMHYLIAATIGFLLGLSVNFLLSIIWVFPLHRPEDRRREMFLFAGIGVIGLIATDILMLLFVETVGLYYVLAKALTTIIVFFWNFFARKFAIYNKQIVEYDA